MLEVVRSSLTSAGGAMCVRVTQQLYAKRPVLRLYFGRRSDLVAGAKALVVGVLHGKADVDAARRKMQNIVSVGIGREPIRTGNVFPNRFKVRKDILVVFLHDVRNRFAITLHDL